MTPSFEFVLGFRKRIPSRHRSITSHFRPKVHLSFERSKYLVKTITSEKELEAVLQFRYDIFHREFQGKLIPIGLDWEGLDPQADHLVIIDKTTEQIVGTYRLISSSFSDRFYSGSEFDLTDFLREPGIKLELSRACIHRDYRNGVVISLLWRGICDYVSKVSADYVFGCSSVNTMDSFAVAEVISLLAKNKANLDPWTVLPLPKYVRRNGLHLINQTKTVGIPPLLQAYLRAGAQVSLHPAWDYSFHCVDFFTVLKTSNMRNEYKTRFK